MLKSLLLEEFDALHLNMPGFLQVVQKSHTCGTMEPKIFFTSNVQPLLEIKSY